MDEDSILTVIKQYISTTYSGDIVIDCKQKDPRGYQQIIQWIEKIKEERYNRGA